MERTKPAPALSSFSLTPNQRLARDICRSQNFLMINKTMIQYLGLVPAAVLSNYIDQQVYFEQTTPENNGWFFLTHEIVENQLGLTVEIVRNCKKQLIEEKILYVEKRGMPAKDWIFVDYERIYETLTYPSNPLNSSTMEKPSTSTMEKPSTGLNTLSSIKILTITEKNLKIIPKKDLGDYLPIAKRLVNIIQSKKRITVLANQFNVWAKEIKTLVEREKVSMERVLTALDWYAQFIGGKYVPVIESGRSFREKFLKLEAAMERSEGALPKSTTSQDPSRIFEQICKQHHGVNVSAIVKNSLRPLIENLDRLGAAKIATALGGLSNWAYKQQTDVSELGKRHIYWVAVIMDYVSWIQTNTWIREINENLFTPQGTIFTKFYRQYTQENNGYDPLTGKLQS